MKPPVFAYYQLEIPAKAPNRTSKSKVKNLFIFARPLESIPALIFVEIRADIELLN